MNQASTLAALLVALAAGCDDQRPRVSAPAASASPADFSNPSSLFQQEAEHQREHAAERPAPRPAPSSVALSKVARAELTSLHVSSLKDGVMLEKVGDAWQTKYTPRCLVDERMLSAALDNLASLTRSETGQRVISGPDFVLSIVARAGLAKLLVLDVGPATQQGQLMQLGDGSTWDVKGFKPALFPADSRAWCRKP
ncbi:MAG TPA: hypothetical protein VIW29_11200 [Polyangiaceae bacterium]